jgi:hypothetical protein
MSLILKICLCDVTWCADLTLYFVARQPFSLRYTFRSYFTPTFLLKSVMILLLLLSTLIFCLGRVHAVAGDAPQPVASPSTVAGKLLQLGLIEADKKNQKKKSPPLHVQEAGAPRHDRAWALSPAEPNSGGKEEENKEG